MSKARVVHKFDVPVDTRYTILNVPHGRVVAAGRQDGAMRVWIEYQPGWPEKARRYQWHATGEYVDDQGEHVATVFDGPFVWHLYQFS